MCNVAYQASATRCILASSFGCEMNITTGQQNVWVSGGCRGTFHCGSGARVACGGTRGGTLRNRVRAQCACPTLAADDPLRVMIVGHHKSGWTLSAELFSYLCCPQAQNLLSGGLSSTAPKLHAKLGWCNARSDCSNRAIRFLWNGLSTKQMDSRVTPSPPHRRAAHHSFAGQTVVHFVRHPTDMLLSGYRYHRLCHESGWTNVSGWVEDGAPAWPGAFPELPWRRRMARALEASPGWDTSLSYCQALQQAGMRAGLHAEALRTLLSEDGLGKMLEDEAFMRHAAFRGQRVSVCMSSPAWPLVFARLNLSVIKWLGSLNSTRVTGLHASHSTSSALRSVSASGSSYQRSARSVLLGLASSHPGIRSSLLER